MKSTDREDTGKEEVVSYLTVPEISEEPRPPTYPVRRSPRRRGLRPT